MQFSIETHDSLPSTQDSLKQKAEDGAPEGSVVQALEQTAGRGRQGNVWTSPPGNLYLSVLLKPDCSPQDAGQLAFVVALAVSGAMSGYTDASKITLKWPNDILVSGLKISGILLESNINNNIVNSVFCGIGLNVSAPPEGAISVHDLTSDQPDITTVRDGLLDHLATEYTGWREKGFAQVRERWLKQAHGLNGPVTARMQDSEKSGTFRGIDENGALIMDVNGTDTLIQAADIHFGA